MTDLKVALVLTVDNATAEAKLDSFGKKTEAAAVSTKEFTQAETQAAAAAVKLADASDTAGLAVTKMAAAEKSSIAAADGAAVATVKLAQAESNAAAKSMELAAAERVTASTVSAAAASASAATESVDKLASSKKKAKEESGQLGSAVEALARRLGLADTASSLLGNTLKGALFVGAAFEALELAKNISEAGIRIERTNATLQAVSGSGQAARAEYRFIVAESQRLGLAIDSTASSYSRLYASAQGTKLQGQGVRDVFSSISEATGRLNLSAADTEGVLLAVSQIISKGTVSSEELRGQIGERLPGAFNIAARAMGVTTAELGKLLESGSVASDVFLPKFAAELRKTFDTDANTRVETTTSNFARLRNEISLLAGEIGSGLNPALSASSGAAASALESARRARQQGNLDVLADGSSQRSFRGSPIEFTPAPAYNLDRAAPFANLGQAFRTEALLGRSLQPSNASSPSIFPLAPQRSQDENDRIAKLNQEFELRKLITEEQRTQYRVSIGDLKTLDEFSKALELRNARQRDAAKAETEITKQRDQAGKRETTEADRAREQDLRRALEKEQADAKAIRAAQVRVAELQFELASGEKATESKRKQIELEGQFAATTKTTLAAEVDKAVALERQLTSRRELVQDADRFAKDIVRRGDKPETLRDQTDQIRRRGSAGGLGAAGDVSSLVGGAQDKESRRYADELNKLKESNQAKLIEDDLYRAATESAETEHADRINQINQAGAEARMDLNKSAFSALSTLGQDFQDSAFAQTKAGFEVSKQVSAAQAGIKTYEAAIGAYNALVNIPYVGPFLAVGAATAATVFGLGQIAKIESQKFNPSGRENGGPVLPGSLYPVGERGRPELLQQGDDFYLIPGNRNGQVVPATRASGNSSGAGDNRSEPKLTLIVNNMDSGQIAVQDQPVRELPDGTLTVELMVSMIRDNASPIRGELSRLGVTSAGKFG